MKKIIQTVLMITVILTAHGYGAVSGPYTADADTLHLYHFESSSNDDITTNSVDLTLRYGATVTETSYPGFGTALNTYEGSSDTASNMPVAYNSEEAISKFVGADGAFTFEAIVRPAVAITAIPNNMQIISGDDDSGQNRGWQFRVTTGGAIEFIKLTGTQENFLAAIPTAGDHAWAVNEWFHVAVTYSGSEGSADNLTFYWTALDSGESQAVLLNSFQMEADLDANEAIDFAIGNESRDATGENFEGLLDEARISSIARQPDDMIFVSGLPRPEILTHPSDVTVQEPQTAMFQTVFQSESAPVVSWFKADTAGDIELNPADSNITTQVTYDSGNAEYTATLWISNTSTPDTGDYYCQVDNDSGYPRNSNTANLLVYGLVAHWTLGQDSYGSGNYLEEVTGNDAAVNGTPTFVTGADGTANGAVQITATDGWALAPVFDPIQQSGQMTISFWANWGETSVTEDDLIAKSTDDEVLTMSNGLKADSRWQHICTVFDGATGKLYVDGLLRDEGSWALPTETEAAINIGVSSDGLHAFNGSLDDMRLYNYALTGTEVAAIHDAWDTCPLVYDLTGSAGLPDCTVDLYDLAAFANGWLTTYDMAEFSDFAAEWLSSGL